jgi:hypothetical protein
MSDTNEAILKTVRRIEDNQAGTDRDLAKDRQHLQDLTIRLEAVESQLSELRKAINQNAERTRDKVAEAVEPVINSTDRLTTQIQRKKMVVLKEKLSWWRRFFGEVKREVK